MFDPEEPPTSFKEFTKQIRKTIESAEIKRDDEFDTAIFYVTKEGEANVVYAYDLYEESDEELDPNLILYVALPSIIKGNDSKYYALVLPAEDQDKEVVMLLTGDINETHLIQAELDREFGDFIELEPWERLDPLTFAEITVPYRRAITLQG